MGRIAARHQEAIEKVVEEAVLAFEEAGESDEAAQAVIVPYLAGLTKQTEEGKIAESTLVKGILPALTKALVEAFETDKFSIRDRFLRADSSVAASVFGMRRRENVRDQAHVEDKLKSQIRWNAEVYEGLRSLAEGWLLGTDQEEVTENDEIARLILGISFFTGRRPWAEVATNAVFTLTDAPVLREWKVSNRTAADYLEDFEVIETPIEHTAWADGWLRFEGNSKPSSKEKLFGRPIDLDIPVLGIDPEDVIEALARLRKLEEGKSWFRSAKSTDQEIVGSVLQTNVTKILMGEVEPILAPIYAAGYQFPSESGRFKVYDFRSLYASRGFFEMEAQAIEGGIESSDELTFVKYFLGHQGDLGRASMAYRAFRYLGDRPL